MGLLGSLIGASAADVIVKIGADTKNYDAAISKTEKSIGGLSGTLGKIGPAAALAGAALAASFVKMSIDMAAAEEVVSNQTRSLLEAQGIMWSEVGGHVDAYMKGLERLTAYNDTDLQVAFNTMLSSGLTYTEALESMNTVTSLAYSKNIDLKTSADLVARAHNGMTGTLSRYGIILQENQTLQEFVNENLASAADRTNTYRGQVEAMNNQLMNAAEAFGAELLPAMTSVFSGINQWGEAGGWSLITDGLFVFIDGTRVLVHSVGTMINSLQAAYAAFMMVHSAFMGNIDAAKEWKGELVKNLEQVQESGESMSGAFGDLSDRVGGVSTTIRTFGDDSKYTVSDVELLEAAINAAGDTSGITNIAFGGLDSTINDFSTTAGDASVVTDGLTGSTNGLIDASNNATNTFSIFSGGVGTASGVVGDMSYVSGQAAGTLGILQGAAGGAADSVGGLTGRTGNANSALGTFVSQLNSSAYHADMVGQAAIYSANDISTFDGTLMSAINSLGGFGNASTFASSQLGIIQTQAQDAAAALRDVANAYNISEAAMASYSAAEIEHMQKMQTDTLNRMGLDPGTNMGTAMDIAWQRQEAEKAQEAKERAAKAAEREKKIQSMAGGVTLETYDDWVMSRVRSMGGITGAERSALEKEERQRKGYGRTIAGETYWFTKGVYKGSADDFVDDSAAVLKLLKEQDVYEKQVAKEQADAAKAQKEAAEAAKKAKEEEAKMIADAIASAMKQMSAPSSITGRPPR